jgi:hypothetical protein
VNQTEDPELGKSTFLDALRERLGVGTLDELRPLTPSNIWLEATAAAYSRLSDSRPEPPPRGAHELRPVISVSGFSPLDEAEIAARALLIAESVALVIPDSMGYVQRLLRLATLLEPVIDEGLLILLPETSIENNPYFESSLALAYREMPQPHEDRAERAAGVATRFEVASAMDAARRYPDRLDLAVTTHSQLDHVRDLLAVVVEGDARRPPVVDRVRFLPDVVSLQIPRIALAADELIRLRRDGVFQDLRRGLTEALRRSAALSDEEVVDPASTRVHEIREYLDDVAAASARDSRRSQLVRRATNGVLAVGVGAATGVLGASGGVGVAAAAGGGAAAAGLALSWLSSRPGDGPRRFRQTVARLFGEEGKDVSA